MLAVAAAYEGSFMYDQFQRQINYMRISLTDRCNLRCRYCRPSLPDFAQEGDALSYEEILRVCRLVIVLGVGRFKITGGEPLLREGAAAFIGALKKLPGAEQVTLTTNGTYFARYAAQLRQAGLDCVNFSLDTLDGGAYARLTGGSLAQTLRGVEAAARERIKFKLNCVLLEGLTERELPSLVRFAAGYGAPLRFIELMPLACNRDLRCLSGERARAVLAQAEIVLRLADAAYGNGPATYYRAAGYAIPVGFIEPLHNKFCSRCNRVRLTSAGLLKTCLYRPAALDLRAALRGGASDDELLSALRRAIYDKPAGHGFADCPADFSMSEIGG